MAHQSESQQRFCTDCGKQVSPKAFTCPQCGVLLARLEDSSKPAIAMALSFFLPGVGQIMYGQTVWGILLLIFTVITLYVGWLITMPIAVGMTASRAFQQRLTLE